VADNPNLMGWRFAFDACGIVGLFYALPLYFLPRDPARPAAEPCSCSACRRPV
jgi:hypothetical protein